MNETDKIKNIFEKFAKEAKMELQNINFYYNKALLTYSGIGNKTIKDLSFGSKKIEEERKINFVVKEEDKINIDINERINIFNENNNIIDNDLREGMLIPKENKINK